MDVINGMYGQGNVAIGHGIGYANSVRSHFWSIDIWDTFEMEGGGTEGWLGVAAGDMRPRILCLPHSKYSGRVRW